MDLNKFPKGAVLVFGGSGGIGQGVAKFFGQSGTDVAIVYRKKKDVADRVAGEISALGRKATVHAADVTDPAQLKAAVADVIKQHGRIHTVVWAAGPVVEQVLLGDVTPALW